MDAPTGRQFAAFNELLQNAGAKQFVIPCQAQCKFRLVDTACYKLTDDLDKMEYESDTEVADQMIQQVLTKKPDYIFELEDTVRESGGTRESKVYVIVSNDHNVYAVAVNMVVKPN